MEGTSSPAQDAQEEGKSTRAAPLARSPRAYKRRSNPSAEQNKRRLARYALKDEQRDARKAISKARKDRDAGLRAATEECTRERSAVSIACSRRRETIRELANAAIAKARARRAEAEKRYAELYSRRPPKSWERKYSRTESDSLAEHNIPDRLLPVWRDMRAQFSYKRQPDDRAVAFLEWVQEHESEVDAELVSRFEVSDSDLAEMERQYYAQNMAHNPSSPDVQKIDRSVRRILTRRWTPSASLIKKLRSAGDDYYRIGSSVSDGEIEDELDELEKAGVIEVKFGPRPGSTSWRIVEGQGR